MATDVTVYDATPAIADGIRPTLYADRDPDELSRLGWVKRTTGWRRVCEVLGWPDYGIHVAVFGEGRDWEEIRADEPLLVAAGAVVFVLVDDPPSPEVAAAGGGRRTTVVGLSADGCRAIVRRGEEWRLTPDCLYPWPCMANAL